MSSPFLSPLAPTRKTGAAKPNTSAPGPLQSRQNKTTNTQTSESKSFSEIEAERRAAKGIVTTQDPNAPTPESNSNKLPDSTFKFNLPPHLWSLPTEPTTVDGAGSPIKDGNRLIPSLSLNPEIYLNTNEKGNFHGLRRGRLWFFDTNSALTTLDKDEETGDLSLQTAPTTSYDGGSDRARTRLLSKRFGKNLGPSIKDRKFGFQFLWNPEAISISVDVNLEVTPSIKDRFRTVSGVFPSMEYINLNITIDRTNDFACIRKNLSSSTIQEGVTGYTNWKKFAEFYKKGTFPLQNNDETLFVQKIQELAQLGTLHDLEYLFKTVNGSTAGGDVGDWANLLGRTTADIGFLQPTLLGIQLGPTGQSLSYVGWLNSININHIAFNQAMVPIRTQVAMGIRCFTGVQVIGG